MASSGEKNEQADQAEKSKFTWNYDEILEDIGQLGKYQLICFLFFCIPIFFPGMLVMSYTFLGGIPEYRCFVDGCDNSTSMIFHPGWLNNTIPFENAPDGVLKPSRCKIYNSTWENINQCWQETNEQLPSIECNKWVYDQTDFTSTIVTEFELTCDNEWKQTLVGTLYMVGMLIGAFSFGSIADWIGRKYAFMILTTWCGAFMFGSAFAPNFETYAVLRVFIGMGGVGYFLVLFVWSVEAVGPKYRIICGFILQMFFTLGNVTLGFIAYYVREWRNLQMIVGAPFFVFLLYWFMPESPRWLISKSKYSEAKEIIEKAAKINKKSIPAYLMELPSSRKNTLRQSETAETFVDIATISQPDLQHESMEKIKTEPETRKTGFILNVFTNFVLCKRALVIFVCWIAAVLGYYGLSMASSTLAGDFYLNYELSMAVEIPSYILGIFVMDMVGRRPTLTTSLLVGGIACLAAGFVPEDPPEIVITLSLIGKFAVSLVYAVVYSYTAELFPTAVRSAVVGMSSTCGRIGGILAPIIASTGKSNPAIPYIIFGSVTLVAGVLSFLLPETRGCRLPATFEDAEDLEKRTLPWTRFCTKENKHRK